MPRRSGAEGEAAPPLPQRRRRNATSAA